MTTRASAARIATCAATAFSSAATVNLPPSRRCSNTTRTMSPPAPMDRRRRRRTSKRWCGSSPIKSWRHWLQLEEMSMKVSIIGGGGLVGSMTAYALQCGGVVSHICLIDANKDLAKGQATDLLHGASLAADQRISAGDMDEVASSDVVVITAGLRRKPDESRLDLINRNVDLFVDLLEQVKSAGMKENSYLIV